MNILSLILIAVGLSIDSLVASISTGACQRKIQVQQALKVALFMSFFQALMPLLGWFIGNSFKALIQEYDHWVAFILLAGIGVKIILDSRAPEEDKKKQNLPARNLLLCGMALATSIDALIVGIGFGLFQVKILWAVLIIGITTFLFSFAGVHIGGKAGKKYNRGMEVFAGLLLFGLGVKILLEHLFF